jgi:hypothetical protein
MTNNKLPLNKSNVISFIFMLTTLILIPLLGSLILVPMRETTTTDISRIKQVALLTTIVTFIISMIM